MIKPKLGYELIIKRVNADMTAYGGFAWPMSGPCYAPDWKPDKECGNGLHGWRWTPSCDLTCVKRTEDERWLLLEVNSDDIIDLQGKCKFPACEVIMVGDFNDIANAMQCYRPSLVGFWGTATAGDRGTATAGDEGTATAGNEGTATAGEGGFIVFRGEGLMARVGKRCKCKPGVAYTVRDDKIVEASNGAA